MATTFIATRAINTQTVSYGPGAVVDLTRFSTSERDDLVRTGGIVSSAFVRALATQPEFTDGFDAAGTAAAAVAAQAVVDSGTYAPISADDRAVTPFQYGGVGDGSVSDESAAVNAALAAGKPKVVLPAGTTWKMASPAVQPNGVSVVIEPGATVLATAAMSNGLWQIGTEATAAVDGYLRGGGKIDANDLAVDGLELVRFQSFVVEDIYANNQTTGAAFHIGRRGAWASSYEGYLRNCHSQRTDGNVAAAGSKGLWVDWAGDSVYDTMTLKGAGKTGVEVNFSGNRFVNIHPWGPNGNLPDYSFHDTHYRNEYVMCAADTPAVYGWYLEAQYTVIIGGNVFNAAYGTDNVIVGVYATHATPTYFAYGITMEGLTASNRIARDYYGTGTLNGTNGCHIMPGSQTFVQTGTFPGAAKSRPLTISETNALALAVRDSTGARYFGVDTSNPGYVYVANGKILKGYSDSIVTEKWRIDSAKGTFRPAALTTAARNALTTLGAGDTVYDTDLTMLVTYDGAAWRNQAGTVV